MNKLYTEGLELAIFIVKNEKELTEERRNSMVESFKDLITQSGKINR